MGGRQETGGWLVPAPRELPELRGRLVTWLGEYGPGFYQAMVECGSQQVLPAGPSESAAAVRLAGQERARIEEAELYWVSAEMTELARHAGRQLTLFELYEHDLPNPAGFMVFQRPIAAWTQHGVTIEIVAVAWGLIRTPLMILDGAGWRLIAEDWAYGGVWFTFYSDPAGPLRTTSGDGQDRVRDLAARTGPFLPDNELVWRLATPEELPTGRDLTSAWGQTVVAAWLLMTQQVAAETRERAPRPARRRLAKAGLPVTDVRVQHIRRAQRPSVDGHAEAPEQSRDCRWWVTGHWRRYHCGTGRQRIERRWISPYIAGPDGAPLRGTDHVQVWDR